MKFFRLTSIFLFFISVCNAQILRQPDEKLVANILHSVSEADLRSWMTYLVSEECGGRLTGAPGFTKAVNYAGNLFAEWGLSPAGDNGTFLQSFDHAYTEVKEGGAFTLYVPVGKDWVSKTYDYPDNYMPGGTSDSGELKQADIVYIGYGITAPDLKYDDYKGIDVKGKIVVCESGTPYGGNDISGQKRWLPYNSTVYKMTNAKQHGAAAVLLLTTKGIVSAGWNEGLLFAGVSDKAVNDFFAGTGKKYAEVKAGIRKNMQPASLALNKKADLKAVTERFPNGKGYNVIGVMPGSDPALASEVIIAAGHIDHIGRMPITIQGALDNASGTIITMGAAKALAIAGFKPKRTVVFILFGGEENGLIGSNYFIQHPYTPLSNIKVMINTDMLGLGNGLGISGLKNFADLVETANSNYVHRLFTKGIDDGKGEILVPRTDGMIFTMNGVTAIGLFSTGHVGWYPYHHPADTPDIIKFDLVFDAAKLLAVSIMLMADAPEL